MIYFIDGNNVYGSRPDRWWNDRQSAAARLAQAVAEWCWTHDDDVVLVFDRPVNPSVIGLGGGNLSVVESPRRGRDAADTHIVDLVEAITDTPTPQIMVVTSDKGLRSRLPEGVSLIGVGQFRRTIGY